MQPRTVIFEKNRDVREMMRRLLLNRGHDVRVFAEPRSCHLYREPECVCPQENSCGDILIMDQEAPGSSALEFIRRQHRRRCRGIVQSKLVLSGNISMEDYRQAQQIGCALMNKPFKVRDFLDWVGACEARIRPERVLVDLPEVLPGEEA